MPRIVSRLFAAAFNMEESVEDRIFMECRGCPNNVHAVMQPFDSEEEGYQWQVEHNKETGHTNFSVYRMQRGNARMHAGS